ncbi:hypothetical protein FF1_024024 [Malus domestica]
MLTNREPYQTLSFSGGLPLTLIHGRIYVVPRTLRFCASTFGAVCGNRHEKLCRLFYVGTGPENHRVTPLLQPPSSLSPAIVHIFQRDQKQETTSF